MGCTSADPNLDPAARVLSRSARHHAADRGDGRRLGFRRGLRRHGHQDRRGAHCGRRRLPHVHRGGPAPESAEAHRSGRALHLVHAGRHAGGGAQAVDCRHAEAGRRAAHRCRRGARAATGPQPAAGGRHAAQRALRARRRGGCGGRRGRGSGARPVAPIPAPMCCASWGGAAARSKQLLGFRGRDEIIHRDDLVLRRAATNPERAAAT